MGGFSFLNFEYLVSKLQRIMTAAPAAAFDMALNTLCPVCANTIKSLEEIANFLNSMQLDDCKAGSIIAAKLLSNVTDDPKIRQEAEKSFTLTKGIQDLAYKLNETWTADNNQPTKTTVEMTSECPAEIKRLFVTPNQTVLEKIAEGTTITADGLALIRGFYGDMVLAVKDGKDGYDPISPCDQDKFSIDRLYTGEVYKRTISGGVPQGCVLIDDTNRNLFQWVFDKVQSIGNKMAQKSNLTPEEESFVNNLPTPVYSALRMAVSTNQLGSTIVSITDIAARAYATKIFGDMANLVYNYVYKGKTALAKQGQSPTSGCQTDLISIPVEGFLDEVKKDIQSHVKFLKDDYARALNENGVINEVARRYEQYDKIAREKLATAFSPALAKRAMGAK